jgi:hypothetical protein
MTLRAIADDGDLLALDEREIGVFVVINVYWHGTRSWMDVEECRRGEREGPRTDSRLRTNPRPSALCPRPFF